VLFSNKKPLIVKLLYIRDITGKKSSTIISTLMLDILTTEEPLALPVLPGLPESALESQKASVDKEERTVLTGKDTLALPLFPSESLSFTGPGPTKLIPDVPENTPPPALPSPLQEPSLSTLPEASVLQLQSYFIRIEVMRPLIAAPKLLHLHPLNSLSAAPPELEEEKVLAEPPLVLEDCQAEPPPNGVVTVAAVLVIKLILRILRCLITP
jgi:hypothetical protein